MTDMPKKVWFNYVNLSGLRWSRPHRGTLDGDTRVWWSNDNNSCAERLGLDIRPGLIVFTSTSYAEVALWTQNAKAMLQKIELWTQGDEAMIQMLRVWTHA